MICGHPSELGIRMVGRFADRLDFEHVIDPVGGVVDQLLASLDALAAEDLAPLFGPALLERLRPLLAAQNRLAAEIARTVREAEVSGAAEHDGLKTMPSWLRGHGHRSEERRVG